MSAFADACVAHFTISKLAYELMRMKSRKFQGMTLAPCERQQKTFTHLIILFACLQCFFNEASDMK